MVMEQLTHTDGQPSDNDSEEEGAKLVEDRHETGQAPRQLENIASFSNEDIDLERSEWDLLVGSLK